MQEAQVYDQLTAIFRDVFQNQELMPKPQHTAKDIQGWDSFKMIEVIMAIEEKYAIRIRARELDALRRVSDLAAIILAKTSG